MSGFDQQWLDNYNKKNDKSKDISSRPKFKKVSKEKQHIEMILSTLKIPYEKEFRFAPTRKFAADFFVPSLNLLIEYEGLVFNSNRATSTGKSGHTTVTGYSSNCSKYNLAACMGFKLLRYTALNVKELVFDLQKLFKDTDIK